MDFFKKELESLLEKQQFRRVRRITSLQDSEIIVNNRKMLLMASNNYLGLANHPRVKEAAIKALQNWGAGTGASRVVSGSTSLHDELEAKLAVFKGQAGATIFNTGYMANVGVLSSVINEEDLIFSDELNHASIVDGIRLSKGKCVIYKHNDLKDLEEKISNSIEKQTQGKRLIVSDGVFSMDGDIAQLSGLVRLKEKYGCLLMIDDAHGTGVLGENGRGTAEHFRVEDAVDINLGTLSKALGVEGGFVAGSSQLIQYLQNKARSFIFSTAIAPASIGAAIAALEVIQDESWRRTKLKENAAYLRKGLQELGFNVPEGITPIMPVIIGSNENTLAFSRRLEEEGIFAPAVRPPSVPAGTGRIRVTVTAVHSYEQLDRALNIFKLTGKNLGII